MRRSRRQCLLGEEDESAGGRTRFVQGEGLVSRREVRMEKKKKKRNELCRGGTAGRTRLVNVNGELFVE